MRIIKPLAITAGIVCVLIGVGAAALGGAAPSHSRPWRVEQERLPDILLSDDSVVIRDVRNFRYRTGDDFTPGYRDETYRLDQVESVWFVLSPFDRDWRGPAHIFLSFGFSDSRYLSISVEARREAGEEYSILKGALRQFELMYVIADERDMIGLRAVAWDDPVYLYPIRATPAQARQLFVLLLEQAHALTEEPQFYNTFTNNCTTNILTAVNSVATEPIPYGLEILLPGYSDRVAHELGLIDTDLPLDAARARFSVNERAKAAVDAEDFSTRIRN